MIANILTKEDLKQYRWIKYHTMLQHNPVTVKHVVDGNIFKNIYFITIN